MINIGIGVSWAKALYSVANNIIANFRARVLSYPNSIFEAGPCLDATLEELNAIGLLDNASLIVTPNAYNEGVLYDVIPNTPLGDMDVVRATTATRVNSVGLIEVVPRNLLSYSQQFNNVYWNKINLSIVPDSITAPNGTLTASTYIPTASPSQLTVNTILKQTANITYTFSFYIKSAGLTDIRCFIWGSTNTNRGEATFNVVNGSVSAIGSVGGFSNTSATINLVNNGYYLCTITTTSDTSAGVNVNFRYDNTISGASGFYIWGAQLEEGSTATEYFPTTTRLNIPRIDYTNGSCPSLLVEPQRTNLLTYSEQFNNAAWSKLRSTITVNATTSPDGTQNADKIVENTDNNSHGIDSPSVSVTSGTSYTASVFAKASERRYIFLALNYTAFTSGNGVCFDLQTGTIAATGTGSSSAGTITNFGNGWYRCTITLIATATSSSVALPAIYMGNAVSSNLPAYPGDGTSGLFIWGAQTEVGSYATSYIPTVASTVTRNADLISKTGISSLIGTEFTLFFDGFESDGGSSSRYIVLKGSGGFYANLIIIEQTPTNLIAAFINDSSSASVFASYSGQLIAGQRVKLALRCKNNDFAFYVNGQLRNAQTSGTVPTTSSLYLGFYTDYADNYNKINSAIIFNTALTDEQCILITGDSYNSYAEMANSLNYILE